MLTSIYRSADGNSLKFVLSFDVDTEIRLIIDFWLIYNKTIAQ